MKIENQVCTQGQAKRLRELGIDQRPATFYYYYVPINGEGAFHIVNYWDWHYGRLEENSMLIDALVGDSNNEIYAAFNVAELGAMLPDDYVTSPLKKGDNGYWSCFEAKIADNSTELHFDDIATGDTEARARANALIRALEIGQITVEVANTSLVK